MTINYLKQITDAHLADLLRRNVSALAEVLQECKERGISVIILARTHELTQHDSPVVASITRTKSETF